MASLSYYFVEPGSWTWNQIWAKFDDAFRYVHGPHDSGSWTVTTKNTIVIRK